MAVVRTTFKALGKKPVADYCRELIEEGVDPNNSLEIYRERETPDFTVKYIGTMARLKLVENGGGRPRYVKYTP